MRSGSLENMFNKEAMTTWLKDSKNYTDILFAAGIMGIISVLIFPIPTWLMDLLLSVSITMSVLVLMTVLFINRSLDFNSFPTVLLVVTMLRLALNISSTRLILANGHEGSSAAGHVIEAFGLFVMQGSIVIGVIVFSILTIINFVVITKGSGRIAEVAARFSLDAMPGKQMAIDADLSAGLIDEATAKLRRKELEDESNFYGSMDGANKFVRGDAIAGILIIIINFVAGIIIGIIQKGMSFDAAIQTYSLLTIGDGLVAQIPALIVSIAAGLLVTKSGTKGSTEKAILAQVGTHPQALAVTSGLLGFMALMPSIPALPFLISSITTGALAYHLYKNKQAVESAVINSGGGQSSASGSESGGGGGSASSSDSLNELMQIDTIRLELGYELLPIINYNRGHKLTDQIKALRKQIAKDLGFIVPSIRIQDNIQLDPKTYLIKIKDIECGKGKIIPSKFLVMEPRGGAIEIPGEDTFEPTFNLAAKWIDEAFKEEALFKGYTVVDPPSIITTHITEVIKENITEIFTYSETQKLIDSLTDEHKKLSGEIIPSQITVSVLQRVLQALLKENISIRDFPAILEAISEIAPSGPNVIQATEHVRSRLAKQICHSYLNENGMLVMVVLSAKWEQEFSENLVGGNKEEKQLALPPSRLQEFISDINQEYEKHVNLGDMPVLLTSPAVRPYVRSVIERFRAGVIVISHNEIHPKIKIKTVGQV